MRGGQIANGVEAKLTIYIVKAQPGMTLDDAFRRYQNEMHGAFPNLRVRGEVVHVQDPAAGLPGVRSEGGEIVLGDRNYMTELVVSLIGGWIIEIRSTYPTLFAPGDLATGIDIPASSFVWATAVGGYAKAANAK